MIEIFSPTLPLIPAKAGNQANVSLDSRLRGRERTLITCAGKDEAYRLKITAPEAVESVKQEAQQILQLYKEQLFLGACFFVRMIRKAKKYGCLPT